MWHCHCRRMALIPGPGISACHGHGQKKKKKKKGIKTLLYLESSEEEGRASTFSKKTEAEVGFGYLGSHQMKPARQQIARPNSKPHTHTILVSLQTQK